jgi:hypothetical protein
MNENDTPLDVDVIVSEEDNSVYVKFSGFNDLDQADNYAIFLSEYLPLMLFQSTVIH